MFEAARALFLYVETPLHAGAGRGIGAVDLPIQRDSSTGYPIVQAGGVKGAMRAAVKAGLTKNEILAIFGPESENASDHAGAVSFGQARTLLFPIRSLSGVFAWITSIDALQRFLRDLAMLEIDTKDLVLPPAPAADEALIGDATLKAGGKVVLEEFNFTPKIKDEIKTLGEKVAKLALPAWPEYDYWRKILPAHLCILPDDSFRHFVTFSTEFQTHIKIDQEKKTVNKEEGALWITESLPADTVMYTPIFASSSRFTEEDLSGAEILEKLEKAGPKRIQLGGNETTGQGVVALKYHKGGV